MSLASINGLPISRLRAQVPDWGAWWVDLDCTSDEPQSGHVELSIGGETLHGTIVSGGVDTSARSRYRVVGGKGGWGKQLPPKPYLDDAGVKLSKVLEDVAREAGETIADLPATRMGPHYARAGGVGWVAADTLNLLAAQNWYVDFAGVTHVGKRASSKYEGDAPRTRIDHAVQVIELATDTISGLAPGIQVDGSRPATDVEYELNDSRLTVRVYAGAERSRRLSAWFKIVHALFPHLQYLGVWEYRVLAQQGERLTLMPARSATGMPALRAVPVRPGLPGTTGTVLPGALVLVTFADPSLGPSRPQVVSFDAPGSPGWLATLDLSLGGPVALPIAYQGSPVQAGPFAGVVTLGSTFGKVRP